MPPAILRREQLQLRIFLLRLFLHEADPGIEVGGRRLARDDADLGIVAHALDQFVDDRGTQPLVCGLCDIDRATAVRRIAVAGEELHALCIRRLDHWCDGGGIEHADGNGIDALVDEVLDDLQLVDRVGGIRRRSPNEPHSCGQLYPPRGCRRPPWR